MLTATEVHYLVGLLTRVSEGTDVEIQLGDFVFDSAADKHRDVDVTVTRRGSNGEVSAFKGIEVKNETRPLDVILVEQLCAKFADMSEVTHKAIVSASGYTKGAANKAEAHNVLLYEIVDWPDPSRGFSIRFPESGFVLTEKKCFWVDYRIHWSLGEGYSSDLDAELKACSPICDSTGAPLPDIADLNALGPIVAARGLDAYREQPESRMPEHNGPPIEVTISVTPNDPVFIKSSNKVIPIKHAVIKGHFLLIVVEHRPSFKVLRLFGTEIPIVGCVIASFENGHLLGAAISDESGMCLLNIPPSDRALKTIKERRLG